MVAPAGAKLSAHGGNAGIRASSSRPELSGGAEYLTVEEGLVIQARQSVVRAPVTSVGFTHPSYLAILALISQYDASVGDALTLYLKTLVVYTNLVPRRQVSINATRELRASARDPSITEGARMLGLPHSSNEEMEEAAAKLSLILSCLLALAHGRANTGRIPEVINWVH